MGYFVKIVEKRTTCLAVDNAPTFEAAKSFCKDLYNTGRIWLDKRDVSGVSFYPVDGEEISILIDNGDKAAYIKHGEYYIADLVNKTIYPATPVASLRMHDVSPNCSPETLSIMFDADICGITKTHSGRIFLWLRRKEEESNEGKNTSDSSRT